MVSARSQHELAEQYLLGLFDFERQRSQRRQLKPFTLDRVKEALEALGHPSAKIPIVHIAGTKGKGSVSMMLEWLLRHEGDRVGVFTSPHLVSLCERVRVGERCIEPKSIKSWSERLHALNNEKFDGELTFFEFLFLLAMCYFEEQNVDMIILETGLGGRLDATNVVDPICSILTLIDYDHCEILGYTLGEIAAEKAGIIKANRPVVALQQSDVVHQVFFQKARVQNAPIHWVSNLRETPKRQNSKLAMAAFEKIKQRPSFKTCDDLENLCLAGRQQLIQWGGGETPLFLDTAHNPISIEALVKAVTVHDVRFKGMLFAMAESRAPEDLLKPLIAKLKSATFMDLPGGRPGISATKLADVWTSLGGESRILLIADLKKWLNELEAPTLITGSFYLVGEVLRLADFSGDDLIPKRITL
jgi:folylpolyglutamate synthase/dihydrofolate synthase